MDYQQAMKELKTGKKISREAWRENDLWLSYSPGFSQLPAEKFFSPHNRAFAESNGGFADVLPCITMKTANGKIKMGWTAQSADMYAKDWLILDEPAK